MMIRKIFHDLFTLLTYLDLSTYFERTTRHYDRSYSLFTNVLGIGITRIILLSTRLVFNWIVNGSNKYRIKSLYSIVLTFLNAKQLQFEF